MGRGKKIIVDIIRLTAQREHFFVQENVVCYSKKFRAVIGKKFISVHDTVCFFLVDSENRAMA